MGHASRHSTDPSERLRVPPAMPPGSAAAPGPNASIEPAGAVRRLREGAGWRRQRRDAVSELMSFSGLPYKKAKVYG